jgi:GTP-binding protein EngB required for normal cell division
MKNATLMESEFDISSLNINYEEFDYEKFFEAIYPDHQLNSHLLMLGRTKSGKSTFIYNLMKHLPEWIPKFVFYNSMNLIEVQKDAHINLYHNHNNPNDISKYLDDPKVQKIVYTIVKSEKAPMSKDELIFNWFQFCNVVYQHEDKIRNAIQEEKGMRKNLDYLPVNNIILVNDELMKVMEDGSFTNDTHQWILTDGQNYRCVHWGATQRNQNVSKILTTQSIHKIIFPIDDYDVGALSDKIRNIQLAALLKPHHFYWINGETGRIKFFKPVKKIW